MQKKFSRYRGLLQWHNYSWWPVIVTLCLISLAAMPGTVQGQNPHEMSGDSFYGDDSYFDSHDDSHMDSSRPVAFYVGIFFSVVLAGLFLAYIYLWITQLVQLMVFRDNDFPGRNDKILWVIIYIVFVPVAPFIFMWWKSVFLLVLDLENNG